MTKFVKKVNYVWEQRKVLDLLIQPITDGPHETPKLVEEGVPFISVDAIVDNKIDFSRKRGNISEEYDELCCKKYKPQFHDVYLVKSGSTVGKVAIVETTDRFNIWSPLAAMRCGEKTYPYFLYDLLQTKDLQAQVADKASNGTQPNLSMRELEKFPVSVPSNLEEQKKIGDYFRNLDHLITLHQRKICIFIKKMPIDWEQRKLGKVLKERTERAEGNEELLSVTISNGVIRQVDSDKRNIASEDKSNYKIVCKGDIAYNSMRMWQGAVGNSEYDGIVSPAYTVLVPTEEANSKFFMELFKKESSLQIFQRWSQGLTSDTWNLKYPVLSSIQFCMPSVEEQVKIGEYFSNLDHLITLHHRKCVVLRKKKVNDWEQRKLGEVLIERNVQHPQNAEFPLVSFTVENGVTPKTDRYEREQLIRGDKKGKKYKETRRDDIVYNPANLKFGAIARNKYGNAVFSPIYVTYEVDKSTIFPSFVEMFVTRDSFIQNALQYQQGTVYERMSVNTSDFEKLDIAIPSLAEQKEIGEYFSTLDHLITLHHRECVILQKTKVNDWEQRKLGELVIIERGGSPRPIDKFITKDENGLNWIKIGDAPEQGNYITQTAEKIKPEGLSKTREVHPGDLILSNSMSFGKPYIMAIDGCIHDGWLVIRDTKKRFDLTFLCTLLGTDSMLNQYKAMAAGSAVNNLNKELVGGTTVLYPDIKEQELIGEYFSHLDHLITLHQHKCDELQNLKKYMLQNMFV